MRPLRKVPGRKHPFGKQYPNLQRTQLEQPGTNEHTHIEPRRAPEAYVTPSDHQAQIHRENNPGKTGEQIFHEVTGSLAGRGSVSSRTTVFARSLHEIKLALQPDLAMTRGQRSP